MNASDDGDGEKRGTSRGGDLRIFFPASQPSLSVQSIRVRLARRLKEDRLARFYFFSPELFGEPAWDILLSLYLADATGQACTAKALSQEYQLPRSTIERWQNYLAQAGLVEPTREASDVSVAAVRLSSGGKSAIEAYLSAVRCDGGRANDG